MKTLSEDTRRKLEEEIIELTALKQRIELECGGNQLWLDSMTETIGFLINILNDDFLEKTYAKASARC